MQLIVNPTARCNFACTFCAASNSLDDLTSKEVIDYAKEIKAQNLIINGGDPLMMSPQFYFDILEALDETVTISIVSNLKDFFLNPNKWIDLFKNPRVSVSTSFNYGGTRRWRKAEPYTEEKFKAVQSLFNSLIGYNPSFIAVIDNSNKDTAIKTVELAKELNTTCRLNNALKLGRQGTYFPKYEIFKIWIEVIERGLEQYEQNCFERSLARCPQNVDFKCINQIRLIQKENGKVKYYNCSNSAYMRINQVKQNEQLEETLQGTFFPKCYYCPLCRVCNACYAEKFLVQDKDKHCAEMTKLKDKIIEYGWKL